MYTHIVWYRCQNLIIDKLLNSEPWETACSEGNSPFLHNTLSSLLKVQYMWKELWEFQQTHSLLNSPF